MEIKASLELKDDHFSVTKKNDVWTLKITDFFIGKRDIRELHDRLTIYLEKMDAYDRGEWKPELGSGFLVPSGECKHVKSWAVKYPGGRCFMGWHRPDTILVCADCGKTIK